MERRRRARYNETVQNDVAVRDDEVDALPVTDTVAEPSNESGESTRRQSKSPTPTRNRSVPLRSATLLLLPV